MTITVGIGEDVDLGDLPLSPDTAPDAQGTLSGVAERGGAPAGGHGGISVQLDGTPFAARTAADGRFALGVPAALYTVSFSDPGFGTESIPDVRVAGAGAVTALPRKVVLSAQPGNIRGVVVAPGAAQPDLVLPNADVVLFAAHDADETAIQTIHPDAAGRFALSEIGAGTWRVLVTLDNYTPADLPEITVGPGQAVDLQRIVLVPALEGVARGHAFLAGAMDDIGAGHTGIRVTDEGTRRFTETEADGSWSLGLPAGHHTLSFTHPGYASPDPADVTLVPGQVSEVADALLAARPGQIQGTVVLAGIVDQAPLLPQVVITVRQAGGDAGA